MAGGLDGPGDGPGETAMFGPPDKNKVDDGSRRAASKSIGVRRARADDVEGRDDADVDGRMLILATVSCAWVYGQDELQVI